MWYPRHFFKKKNVPRVCIRSSRPCSQWITHLYRYQTELQQHLPTSWKVSQSFLCCSDTSVLFPWGFVNVQVSSLSWIKEKKEMIISQKGEEIRHRKFIQLCFWRHQEKLFHVHSKKVLFNYARYLDSKRRVLHPEAHSRNINTTICIKSMKPRKYSGNLRTSSQPLLRKTYTRIN